MSRRHTRWSAATFAVLLGGAAVLAAAPAAPTPPTSAAVPVKPSPDDEAKALFDSGMILEIAVEFTPDELKKLRKDNRSYVKATIREGANKVYPNVGVHMRGAAGSFRDLNDKPGLTCNANKFENDQLFHGMDKFHLVNCVQDPSYVSELICGDLFRAAGVPAARLTHAVVTIDGRRRGLYAIKEGYDKYWLKRNFGDGKGNFYDGGFLKEANENPKLLSGKGDVGEWKDVKGLIAATKEKDLAKRFEQIDKLLDVDKFLAYTAIEVITADWDGYPVHRNNYRMYHDPKRDKITFVPSGMDQMFGDVYFNLLPNFEGDVARKLIETPEGKSRYLAKIADVMKNAYKVDELIAKLDDLEARLLPALAALDRGAARDYPNHVERLRRAIRQRAKSVDEQLKRYAAKK